MQSKISIFLWVSFLVFFKNTANAEPEVCPRKMATVLRYVDVFDEPPEDMATLVPDSMDEASGSWQLGYVYAAGRTVTIRCKYNNGEKLDIKLPQKIEKCNYNVDKNQTFKVMCQ